METLRDHIQWTSTWCQKSSDTTANRELVDPEKE